MLQNTTPPTLSPLVAGLFLVANGVTGVVTGFVTWFLTRTKQTADISQSQALTRKTDAETQQIGSTLLFDAWRRIDDMEGIIRRQNIDSMTDKRRIAELEWDTRRLPLLESQLAHARATLNAHEIQWDETA
jgi:hypothetical protein